MVKVKLKETLRNDYPKIRNEEELKKKSFEVFRNLENVVKQYENFTPIEKESYYNDDLGFFSFHWSKGKLKYNYYTNPGHTVSYGRLEIEFFSRKSFDNNIYYNRLNITLYGNTEKVDVKIINDLADRFKSFEKPQEGD